MYIYIYIYIYIYVVAWICELGRWKSRDPCSQPSSGDLQQTQQGSWPAGVRRKPPSGERMSGGGEEDKEEAIEQWVSEICV